MMPVSQDLGDLLEGSRLRTLKMAQAGALLVVIALCGCTQITRKGHSPLVPARMSPDSVSLEIFFLRLPADDPQTHSAIWNEIDEQRFDPDLRRRWAQNGLRAGVVSGQLPLPLQQLLGLAEGPPMIDESVVRLDEDAPVLRRQLQIRAGHRSEILANGVRDPLDLLLYEEGQVRGRSYPKGQGVFALKSFPQGDGRVRLEVTPELHHGDAQHTFVGNQTVLRLESGRPKVQFERLTLSPTLAAGEMLVLTNLPERACSLGHYLFSEESAGRQQQRLLLIRAAQTQYDDLFGRN